MSQMMEVMAVLLAVGCMYLAQAKSVPQRDRKGYSLIGSAASIVIAFEAMMQGKLSISLLFAAGAAVSLITLTLDYLNPGNPDA